MSIFNNKVQDYSFIDMHAHILPGVDDGARNAAESKILIAQLRSEGAEAIICTPHYIVNTDSVSPVAENKELLKMLKEEEFRTPLYIGNELYIDEDLDILLKKKQVTGLAGSRYILVELPMSGKFEDYEDILNYLNRKYKVILAHPERYVTFQKDFDCIERLMDMGIRFQCNYGTLMGQYGGDAKKTLKKMLKKRYVFAFGSDIHRIRPNGYYCKAIAKLSRIVKDENYLIDIIHDNPKRVILAAKKQRKAATAKKKEKDQ